MPVALPPQVSPQRQIALRARARANVVPVPQVSLPRGGTATSAPGAAVPLPKAASQRIAPVSSVPLPALNRAAGGGAAAGSPFQPPAAGGGEHLPRIVTLLEEIARAPQRGNMREDNLPVQTDGPVQETGSRTLFNGTPVEYDNHGNVLLRRR